MPLLPQYLEDEPQSSSARPRDDLEEHAVISREGAIYASFSEQLAPYLAEFVGTFLLTMTFLCNYSPTSSPVWTATSNGFMVAALTYAFGHLSGANLNPSVSISLIFAGRHSLHTAARLCLAQTLGAISAAVLRMQLATHHEVDIGPFPGRHWTQVGLVEAMYTALICFTYLNCAASMRNNPIGQQNGFVGLAMGFCFIASGYAARHISHTVTNPAIAIGLTIADSSGHLHLGGLWYFVYDLFGAFLGAGAFRIVRPREASKAESVIGHEDTWEDPVSAQLASEFFGTFFVVFTKALNRLGRDTSLGPEAWSVGAVLSANVYSLKGVSGAFFNPSVTLACWLSGQGALSNRMAALSALVQVIGGLAATTLYATISHEGISMRMDTDGVSAGAVAFTEGAFTALTCYVVLTTSAMGDGKGPKKQPNNVAGLTYGACHVVGGFSIANISGSLLNPAVVLAFGGLNILNLQWNQGCFVYVFYQVLGALVASAVFTTTHSYEALRKAKSFEDNLAPRPAA